MREELHHQPHQECCHGIVGVSDDSVNDEVLAIVLRDEDIAAHRDAADCGGGIGDAGENVGATGRVAVVEQDGLRINESKGARCTKGVGVDLTWF